MILYEKLGIDPNKIALDEWLDVIKQYSRGPSSDKLTYMYKISAVSDYSRVAYYCYLLEDRIRCIEFAGTMLECLYEYYYGEWKKKVSNDDGVINPDWWKVMSWINEFRDALLWGSSIDRWEILERIACYPDEDCWQDDLYSKEFHIWYLLVACVLRQDANRKILRYMSTLEQSRKMREKLLAHVLQAILKGDESQVNTELNAYLKFYKKKEFTKPEITEKVSIDGTFLINFARHKGIKVKYASEYEDHIVKLT